jgi:hypothetical protein
MDGVDADFEATGRLIERNARGFPLRGLEGWDPQALS